MAIISKYEKAVRAGSFNADKLTYTREWLVEAESTDNPREIYGADSLPVYGSVCPFDADAFCSSISINETGDGGFYSYVVTYDTITPDETEQDPLDKPAQYSWSTAEKEEIVDKDISGNPVLNSAEDPFDPGITRIVATAQCDITKNFATFDGSAALTYTNKLNSATFLGGAIGTVFCRGVSANGPNIENDITFWSVTFSFLYDAAGWQKEILNQGMRQVISGVRKPIYIDGREITSPVNLDASGGVLAPGGTTIWLPFNVYDTADFTAISF